MGHMGDVHGLMDKEDDCFTSVWQIVSHSSTDCTKIVDLGSLGVKSLGSNRSVKIIDN